MRCHDDEERDEAEATEETTNMNVPYTGEVVVPATEQPPPAPPGKKIHPRRPLPPVKEPPDRLS